MREPGAAVTRVVLIVLHLVVAGGERRLVEEGRVVIEAARDVWAVPFRRLLVGAPLLISAVPVFLVAPSLVFIHIVSSTVDRRCGYVREHATAIVGVGDGQIATGHGIERAVAWNGPGRRLASLEVVTGQQRAAVEAVVRVGAV